MASLEQLQTALVNADKAGDSGAATALANEILRIREAPPSFGGIAAEAGKGLLRGASDIAMLAGKAGASAVLGPLGGELVGKGIDAVPVPFRKLVTARPENASEKFAGTAGEIFGAGVAGGGVRSIGGAALNAMAAIGGASGEQIGGPIGRIIGTLAPTVATVAIPSLSKLAIRGGESSRQNMADRIETFKRAGIESPSVGQATGGRIMQAAESAASKTPGSAGIMAKSAESEADGMGKRIEEIASALSPNATGTKAGATIESGIKAFVDRFKGEQNNLYGKLDQYIPKSKPIDMTNTINRMAELNADIAGAPALSKFFKNSTIQALESALKSDTQEFTTRLPYEALKKVRTLVGGEISNANLLSQVPRDKWKALYAALSKDLEQAAVEAGPNAVKAFGRANAFSAAGYNRIESVLNRVVGKDTVEKIFKAATNPSEIKEGATTINAVLRSLEPEERNVVKAAFIKRLGDANPGAQDATGEVFSAQTFLTNWNKISQEAKQTLFARGNVTGKFGPEQPEQLRKNLDTIAKAASMIREGSKVFANPSGTTQAAANIGGLAALGGALVSGNFPLATTLLGGAVGINLTSRLLTNQKFVEWLAQTVKVSPALLPIQINALAQSAQKMEPGIRGDIDNYLSELRKKTGQTGILPQTGLPRLERAPISPQ